MDRDTTAIVVYFIVVVYGLALTLFRRLAYDNEHRISRAQVLGMSVLSLLPGVNVVFFVFYTGWRILQGFTKGLKDNKFNNFWRN